MVHTLLMTSRSALQMGPSLDIFICVVSGRVNIASSTYMFRHSYIHVCKPFMFIDGRKRTAKQHLNIPVPRTAEYDIILNSLKLNI